MPRFEIAHIHHGGVDLIIVPLEPSFGFKSRQEQRAAIAELQARASAANLCGTLVPVWGSVGHMAFIAPSPWRPFFESINLHWVAMNLNRDLYW